MPCPAYDLGYLSAFGDGEAADLAVYLKTDAPRPPRPWLHQASRSGTALLLRVFDMPAPLFPSRGLSP
jgi:hypothetical protein